MKKQAFSLIVSPFSIFALALTGFMSPVCAQSDASIEKVIPMSVYHKIPFDQVNSSLNFGAIVKNDSSSTLRDLQLKYELYHNGTVILSDSLSEDSLLYPGSVLMQANSTLIPFTRGTYHVKYTLTHSAADASPNNNVSSIDTLIVGDSVLQRYRSKTIGGSFCPPHLTQGEMGAIYFLPNRDTLTSVSAGISNTGSRFAQLNLSAHLRAVINGKPDSIIASTDTLSISNHTSQFITLHFKQPAIIDGDTFMISMVQEDSCISLGANSNGRLARNDQGAYWFSSSGLQGAQWIEYPSGTANLGLMISANFGNKQLINSVPTNSRLLADLKLYPNPLKEQATLRFALQENADVELMILDLLGRVVYREAKKPLAAGKHEYLIDRKNIKGEKGNYMLQLKVNDAVINQSIILF